MRGHPNLRKKLIKIKAINKKIIEKKNKRKQRKKKKKKTRRKIKKEIELRHSILGKHLENLDCDMAYPKALRNAWERGSDLPSKSPVI